MDEANIFYHGDTMKFVHHVLPPPPNRYKCMQSTQVEPFKLTFMFMSMTHVHAFTCYE
jgi:hypothetical protein